MKKKMMQARRCVLCVVCCVLGGDQGSHAPSPHAPSPMPPAPCPQPHASRGEQGEPIRMASNTSPSPFKPPPSPHASCPQPHASRGEQRAPGLHACEMTLSQCPHAPSPRIQWGWGQLARIQTCAPSPMPPAPGGMGPSPFAWIHPHAQC